MTTNSYAPKDSGAWRMFTMASFAIAASMIAGGIYFLEASFAAKGFYAMAAIMLVHTSITITKTCATPRKQAASQARICQGREALDGHQPQ